jgi:hypothetical protein
VSRLYDNKYEIPPAKGCAVVSSSTPSFPARRS